MTRQEIREMARKRLGETIGAFWSDTELNLWINKAGVDCAFKSKSLKGNTYFTTTTGIAEYALSSILPTALSVLEVYHKIGGTTWRKMKYIANREDMDMKYPGWLNANSAAPYVYLYIKEEDLFYLFPGPDASNAGVNFTRVFHSVKFVDLANDNSTPNLAEPLHLAMVDWVAYMGFETRGYGDKANDALMKYTTRINDYLRETKREKEDDEIVMRSYRIMVRR